MKRLPQPQLFDMMYMILSRSERRSAPHHFRALVQHLKFAEVVSDCVPSFSYAEAAGKTMSATFAVSVRKHLNATISSSGVPRPKLGVRNAPADSRPPRTAPHFPLRRFHHLRRLSALASLESGPEPHSFSKDS